MNQKIVFVLAMVLSIASFSNAALLSNLLVDGATLEHDGLTLSDWTYSQSGDPTPAADSINVESNGSTLTIQYAGNDFPNPEANSPGEEIIADGLLMFRVSGRPVTGVVLNANPNLGGGAGNGSYGEVVEGITETPFDPNVVDLTLFVENQPENSAFAPGPDSITFPEPISSFKVTKDIQLLAVDTGRVTISVIEQQFVPEPAGLGMALVAALAGLGMMRRRR